MQGGRHTQNDSQGAARGDAACSRSLLWPLVCRYFELKMNLHEVQTVEDITYIESPPGEYEARRRRSRLESVDAENVISISQEERKRYIVSSVNDPRDETNKLTLEQATSEGIVHYPSGKYVNPDTGQGQNAITAYFDILQFLKIQSDKKIES